MSDEGSQDDNVVIDCFVKTRTSFLSISRQLTVASKISPVNLEDEYD